MSPTAPVTGRRRRDPATEGRAAGEHGPRRPTTPRRAASRVVLYVVLGLLTLVIVLPLLWMLLTSLRTDADTAQHPYSLPSALSLDAYRTLLTSAQQPIFRWLWNSFLAASLQALLILVTASLAAYALARLDFPGKKIVFGLIITTLMVPSVVFLIPNYLIVQGLGWIDTIFAITVPGAASAFGVFFLRQFFLGLPYEIEEAARLDGAGEFRIFFRIALPLAKPALATLAVLSFLTNWNDFLWPVYVLLSPENMTLQPGLSMLQGAYRTHYAVVMAGAAVAAIPVLILFSLAQRQVVDSVAGTAVKG